MCRTGSASPGSCVVGWGPRAARPGALRLVARAVALLLPREKREPERALAAHTTNIFQHAPERGVTAPQLELSVVRDMQYRGHTVTEHPRLQPAHGDARETPYVAHRNTVVLHSNLTDSGTFLELRGALELSSGPSSCPCACLAPSRPARAPSRRPGAGSAGAPPRARA